MDAVDTRSFKSGNSVAVRFPRRTGLQPDRAWTIIRVGDEYRIRPKDDPVEAKRRLRQLVDDLLAISPADEIEIRDPDIFPDRPGLYD